MATITEVEPKIDPTVPLQGFPAEAIQTAEWHVEEEIITVGGLERRIPRKYPKLNGIVFNEMTSPNVWRKVLDWFPKEPVIIPESDDERSKRERSGNRYRAAEPIIWNGVQFMCPKGIPVMVPQPLAQMVSHMNELYRTEELMRAVRDGDFVVDSR